MKSLIILAASIVLTFSIARADDTQLDFVTITWEPYAGEIIPGYGIASTIISKACARVGLTAKFHFLPWTRAMDETKAGDFDALYNAYYSPQRDEDYGVSECYFQTILTLCTKSSNSIDYDGTTQSLHKYRLGVVRGFVNTKAIDSDKELNKDEAENDVLNLRKLLHDRVDLIVIDKYQALHLVKNSPIIEADMADIRFIYPALEQKSLHVMFSKNRTGWQQKLELFNKGLKEIKKDGTLKAILLSYGFPTQPMEE
ncbi:transporter substrate-binding domain-containing protein [Pseudodesulfovibrio sp. zrk46]|uniref:substrate-binding periplasmic protein n=1 Tax=Pseudodesulfovibrio sp. zrk46 TaxID=2725288 RepID=UPI0014498EFC|nr:transporter substrate-binding domain-containing protein [Pseudodesulfovibrio sp. zrk46]QJB57333.1 amino acid ABC transporter substrate-binding protein [Pseudodesulfovibrio sp. zrk46]